MTWDHALTWLILPAVVSAGIAYVVTQLRSGALLAPWSRRITRGQTSSRDPIDDVW